VLPFLQTVTHHCKPRELTVAMAAAYDLDAAGVAFVTGSGESTNKVESIVEDAQERREEQLEAHAGDAFAVRVGESESGESGSVDGKDEPTATDDGSTTDKAGSNTNEDESAAPDDETDDDGQSGLSDFV